MTATTKSKTENVPAIPAMTTSVLNTPEILEMILVQTDIRTLLTSAQRVCHDWLNLITTSPSIQKALYFTPIKPNYEEESSEMTLNPLLAEKFCPIFPSKKRPGHYGFDFSDLEWTKDPSALTRFARADASWRKMLVQQPPISELGLFGLFHAKGGDSARCGKIPAQQENEEKNCEGLRMGQLFDILLFARHVQFSAGLTTQVHWAAEPVIDFSVSHGNLNVTFHKMLAQFGVVLYTRTVMKCYIGVDTPVSDSESTRREIIEAYEEQGIDADYKARKVDGSRTLV